MIIVIFGGKCKFNSLSEHKTAFFHERLATSENINYRLMFMRWNKFPTSTENNNFSIYFMFLQQI